MSYKPVIKQVGEVLALCWRETSPLVEVGERIPALFHYAAEQELELTGPLFNLYYSHEFDEYEMDFATCLPVNRVVADKDKITCITLPAARVLSLVHYGPYEKIVEAYKTARDYISERGLKILLPSRELYLKTFGHTDNPEEFITELQFPIAE
ncbi:MAG: GyrI-like domain-containing protein [Peptococcaceae bacterium]|nr:GyrI-like domain-containing protein [Peptococcaceae bacterium]